MEAGIGSREAARRVGVNYRTVKRWRAEAAQAQAATTPAEMSSRFLSLLERIVIADRIRQPGISLRAIAAELGCPVSTITRELAPNQQPDDLPVGYTPSLVRDALVAKIQTLPQQLRRSLAWDQGSEMHLHGQFTAATSMPVYFCDPHAPWQRGSNENTNGLLRQYFPKGTDLSVHTAEHLDTVALELNDRPRMPLDWDSPAERMTQLLNTHHQQQQCCNDRRNRRRAGAGRWLGLRRRHSFESATPKPDCDYGRQHRVKAGKMP